MLERKNDLPSCDFYVLTKNPQKMLFQCYRMILTDYFDSNVLSTMYLCELNGNTFILLKFGFG